MKLRNVPRYLLLLLGLKNDDEMAFRLVAKLGRRLIPRYRFTWPQLAWFESSTLTHVLSRFDEEAGFNAHRRLAIQQLIRLTTSVPGDTAECGTYKGCGSYLILQANRSGKMHKMHHIFDSFEGLSAPSVMDGKFWKKNDMAVGERAVADSLSEFSEFRMYKGWIPDRFADVGGAVFSFVHIDVDLYDPTLKSMEFFYGRLSKGAIVVCDDYGFTTCPGATRAIDEYLRDKPEKMVLLAGGGGFFVKGCATMDESV